MGRGTFDFGNMGGGFRPYMDSIDQANSIGRRVGRVPMGGNNRSLRTAARPDAPMLTRQVPEEYEELVKYQDPDYFNYVRNNSDLRSLFEATPEAKKLAEAAWDGETGAIDKDKFDGGAYRDAAIAYGQGQYEADPNKYDMPMIDRQRYETKQRMVDEQYEGERPDRERLFDSTRNAIQDRLYNRPQNRREYNPYNFDSYSPGRRAAYRGGLDMGMGSLYGMPPRRTGRVGGGFGGGFGGGDMIGVPAYGGMGGGMFGGMQQQAPFGGMFGGGQSPYNTSFGGRRGGGMFGGMNNFARQAINPQSSFGNMGGGMFGGAGRALGSMFGPRGGRGMFDDLNDMARRGMQARQAQGLGGGGNKSSVNQDYAKNFSADNLFGFSAEDIRASGRNRNNEGFTPFEISDQQVDDYFNSQSQGFQDAWNNYKPKEGAFSSGSNQLWDYENDTLDRRAVMRQNLRNNLAQHEKDDSKLYMGLRGLFG